MAHLLLKTRLAMELPKINAELTRIEKTLPPKVQPICHHIFAAGGKRLRPLLTVLTSRLFGFTSDAVYTLAVSLEMLHAATLLHDDVIDNAPLRRGSKAAHLVFGTTPTILAGDALLAEGNALVASFGDCRLSKTYSHATSATCNGEIAEIQEQHNPTLSLDKYIAILVGKTATLIQCACEMGAIVAGASEEEVANAASFGVNIGIAFQLVDDALDFADEKETGKPSGGDISEGKMTLPLRYFRETLSAKEQENFDTLFSKGGFSNDQCKEIAKTIRTLQFDIKTRAFADTYLAQAEHALTQLPDVSERSLLFDMTNYVRDRKK